VNHAELVDRGVRWLRGTRGCRVVLAEPGTGIGGVVPDLIGWSASGTELVEVKVSRSDFAADRRKPIHWLEAHYPGRLRWYLTPAGLVVQDEVPDGWGLAELLGGRIYVRRQAVPLLRSTLAYRREMAILVGKLVQHERSEEFGLIWCRERARFLR